MLIWEGTCRDLVKVKSYPAQVFPFLTISTSAVGKRKEQLGHNRHPAAGPFFLLTAC